MAKPRSVVALLSGLVLAGGAWSEAMATVPSAPRGDTRIPGFPDVIGEFVAIPGSTAPGTPAGLNAATFLRVRSVFGGLQPNHADAVLVAQPGFASTAGLWLNVAAGIVHNAGTRHCAAEANGHCQVEVWVVQRRSNLLTDTQGLFDARVANDPSLALDYYFGPSVLGLDATRPGKFPVVDSVDSLIDRPDATFRELAQADVPFMAEWGFATYAEDVSAMVALIKQPNGTKNIFLGGHSQGGLFTSVYAGAMLPSGIRGQDQFAGLFYLDGGPSATQPMPSAAQVTSYLGEVDALRSGKAPVFGETFGNLTLDPASGAASSLVGLNARKTPQAESILPPAQFNQLASVAGNAFLAKIRTTYQAEAGLTFDPNPVPGGLLQSPIIQALGSNMGRLNFTPVAGSSPCDPLDPQHRTMPPCPANADEIDPNIVYGWLDGGALGPAPLPSTIALDEGIAAPVPAQPSTAEAYANLAGFAPSLTNIRPLKVTFPVSGTRVINGSQMTGTFWYPSARYEDDMGFLAGFSRVQIGQDDVALDIDTTKIDIPIYAAKGPLTPFRGNPYPLVKDYSEINPAGVIQSAAAAAILPFDTTLNSALYNHSDFPTADDSQAGLVKPGQPGANLVADTLVDWLLAHAHGQAVVPTPASLGVVETR